MGKLDAPEEKQPDYIKARLKSGTKLSRFLPTNKEVAEARRIFDANPNLIADPIAKRVMADEELSKGRTAQLLATIYRDFFAGDLKS